VIRFGLTTDSYDVTGSEVSRSDRVPARDAIEAALDTLRGDQMQVPPAFSAKKVAGQRAYTLARRAAKATATEGAAASQVVLEPVAVKLTRADLLDFNGATARVAVSCSAGFYVRSFAHELGERVGTGACLESLRRTRSGQFDLSGAVSLEALQQDSNAAAGQVVPLDRLLLELPGARLTDEGRTRVSHGQDVHQAHLWPEDTACLETAPESGTAQWVRLLDGAGRLLALARVAGSVTAVRGPRALHPAVVLF
jgi:tRNA pseudouridine55 synthase